MARPVLAIVFEVASDVVADPGRSSMPAGAAVGMSRWLTVSADCWSS